MKEKEFQCDYMPLVDAFSSLCVSLSLSGKFMYSLVNKNKILISETLLLLKFCDMQTENKMNQLIRLFWYVWLVCMPHFN